MPKINNVSFGNYLLPATTTPTIVSSFQSDSSNLDILRSIAVLCVFFAHLRYILTDRESFVGWHLDTSKNLAVLGVL
jgi:peptidoglycan/LPS O-acetylase OafA/YrhL